ncbi:MAG: hypothetical protein ABI175_10035 [Polyangiales bacterium]
MMKNILTYFGAKAAPTPYKKYVSASSVLGVVPVAAYFAWKNRDAIKGLYDRKIRGRATPATPIV